ncbi:lasso peptide biosynthesis PqqD family chaperone [Pseudonocardia alaniniphila]|uniref:Lasso peptide biosynthesis PqqD family chaperone n=1 Tax=Pseudonocardia alaniniphila TaxID=75291 RepID=A0ABS9TK68_9PSEU|nr:lasso peptide biosynthesis PqqD family chaperone [Pseudonocardia alaniniphila]MCH6168651.1 lasso peptide biosynthesis PqqD family chaperone [Pseudonocardia alaniniphila]
MRLRTEVVAVDTEDARVLLDERTGRYFQLNRPGALILDAVLADEDAAQRLTEVYAVDPERAAADVADLLERLRAAGLVVT